jgi:putative transposase
LRILREAESGWRSAACAALAISQQSFYLWKKRYAGLGLSELRELRQLRDENGKLKRLVADLSTRIWRGAGSPGWASTSRFRVTPPSKG